MTNDQPSAVSQLRVIVTSADFERDLPFYRDVLGLTQLEDYSSDDGRAVLLGAGLATIELADEGHAASVDALEVGRRVAGPIRLAFQVGDTETSTANLVDAGGTLLAAPTATPWDSVNSRLEAPGGQQLTLFTES